MFKRVFLIVIDGLGVGEDKYTKEFNDEGANTLKHVLETRAYNLQYLNKLGLLSLVGEGSKPKAGYYTTCTSKNMAKDTLDGHYEMMGIVLDKPFKTYPNGFPLLLISEIQRAINREVIGNCVASGTQIIEDLGEMHMKTGSVIIYTSADSVLQVAAHKDIVPVEELYDICEKISKIVFREEYQIGRVIARPFIGSPGKFKRTENRKDFTKEPPKNYMTSLYESGLDVIALGKIKDIFADKNITTGIKTRDNLDGIVKLIDFARGNFNGLLFLNLNDTDTLYGHRRDREGYLKALEEIDSYIPALFSKLTEDDLLIITGDHGNDPTYKGTDHTREKTPLIIYSKRFQYRGHLPELDTMSDIGATIIDNFGIKKDIDLGKSILNKLK